MEFNAVGPRQFAQNVSSVFFDPPVMLVKFMTVGGSNHD